MTTFAATDEGTEGRSPVTIRHYKVASVSSSAELVTTYETLYIHALAHLIASGPCYVRWNGDDSIDVFSMRSMAHVMAASAVDMAIEQEYNSGMYDDKIVAADMEAAKGARI